MARYDSIIVSGRQFESLWPRHDSSVRSATKKLLGKAKSGGASADEIKRLSPPRSGFLPSRNFAAAIIGIAAMLFGLGVYESWQSRTALPIPPPQRTADSTRLSDGSSRMEVWRQQAGVGQDKHVAINFYVMNGGKVVAERFSKLGIMAMPHGLPPTERQLAGYFAFLRGQVGAETVPGTDNESAPGQKNIWFTIEGPPANKETLAAPKYAFVLMRYRDTTIPAKKFIYTEICVYWVRPDVIYFCESGHNGSYVAD